MASQTELTASQWIEKLTTAIEDIEGMETGLLEFVEFCKEYEPKCLTDNATLLREMIDVGGKFVQKHAAQLAEISKSKKDGLLPFLDPVPYRKAILRLQAAIAMAESAGKASAAKIKPIFEWTENGQWLYWGNLHLIGIKSATRDGRHCYKIDPDSQWDILFSMEYPGIELILDEEEDCCYLYPPDNVKVQDCLEAIFIQILANMPCEVLSKTE